MKKRRPAWRIGGLIAFLALGLSHPIEGKLLILTYHDVPIAVTNDLYAVSVRELIEQIEYLKTHGYSFIRPDDFVAAQTDPTLLPEKSVLLSFDDGYSTFSSNVIPILEMYNCPAMLAVCASWIETDSPKDVLPPLMTWDEVSRAATHPLVTLASHSYGLHKAIPYNPQSNTAHAVIARYYDAQQAAYETEAMYRTRIEQDFKDAAEIFLKRIGRAPDIIVWPYGSYSQLSNEIAKQNGYRMAYTTSDYNAQSIHAMELNRWIVAEHPDLLDWISEVKYREKTDHSELPETRWVQADLDMLYDPDPKQTERNLGAFLDRMADLQPNVICLQAFADPDGDGNVEEVYFPNRALPMRMDLLNRVANQLYIRGFSVYISMPVLSVIPPAPTDSEPWLVMEEQRNGKTRTSSGCYRRLSPFHEQTAHIMTSLYDDLAAHVRFHGILFQDDAYLNTHEDRNPAAQAFYQEHYTNQTPETWTQCKTKQLNAFTQKLMQAVRRHRPQALFARNLYAPVLTTPCAESQFSQTYCDSLALYDQVVVMAYPRLEEISRPNRWLKKLVENARRRPNGLDKTVFKTQAFDWKKQAWIDEQEVLKWIRTLIRNGAKHIAYDPDNYTVNRPRLDAIRMEMSVRSTLTPRPAHPAPAVQSYPK